MGNGWGNYCSGNNFYGYDPFFNGGFGYGGYSPFGWNNGWNNGWGNSWNNGWGNSWGNNWGNPWNNPWNNSWNNGWITWGGGNDVFTTTTYVIRPRTPLSTNVLTNSNYNGGRLESNKIEEVENNDTQVETQTSSVNRTRNPYNRPPQDQTDSQTQTQTQTQSREPNQSNSNNSFWL